MKKYWLIALLVLLAAAVLLAVAALDDRLIIRRYTLRSEKIQAPVRLALISDLHECHYGENGADLIAAIAAQRPDAVLIAGDWFADGGDFSYGEAILRALSENWFTYYVEGNHEAGAGSEEHILGLVEACGVSVLHGSSAQLFVDGTLIRICGIPAPYAGAAAAHCTVEEMLARASSAIWEDEYAILLAHHPELIDTYAQYPFDLVVAGHAHGGQVRIPGLINGLCAPNQGWFPQYAGGRYRVGDMEMIVSRGLSNQAQWYVPRVFNRPEVVIIELQ